MLYMVLSLLAGAAEDPFAGFRYGFVSVVMALLGIAVMVSLTVVVIHVINGDKEGAQKMIKWLVATVVGLILINIIGKL